MEYKITGGNLPVVRCKLEKGETIHCESGGMSWMDNTFKMDTNTGGAKTFFSKFVTAEKLMRNKYTAEEDGEIAFASCFPGSIGAMEIKEGETLIAQDSAYLADYGNISMSIFFQKKIGTGLFGGKGFIMQKFVGEGTVFLEFDGSVTEYELAEGEKKIIDTGYLVAMEGSCSMDITMIKGVKNIFFGGEGLFNTTVTGPGKIYIQSMPISKVANKMYYYMPGKTTTTYTNTSEE
ncbi:MAG: TIGR00266 family protein [Bacilli bacterium]|nr:TIGR00266 family protein [Bacilli bacterium]